MHAPLLLLGLAGFVHLPAGVRQQGDMTSLLDGLGNYTLVFCARASLAAWANIAFFGDVFAEKVSFLIVNGEGLICTELTKLGLGKEATFAAALLPIT
jgi:hypothetical protein